MHRKIVPGLSLQKVRILEDLIDDYFVKELKKTGVSYPQIVRYVLKQSRGIGKWYNNAAEILRDWRDYLNDCRTLEMDISSDRVKFPENLHEAHQRTIKQIQIKKNQRINRMIRKRLKMLNRKYRFENGEFIIRPAASAEELIREGNELNHCVSRYVERYASGECDILFVRRACEPDKPFYTMEISKGSIVQCRGLKNCSMTPDVRAFIEVFRAMKLETPTRIKNAYQEVAV